MLDVPVHFVSIPDAAIRYWMRREQRRRYLRARIGVRGLAIVNDSTTIFATLKLRDVNVFNRRICYGRIWCRFKPSRCV